MLFHFTIALYCIVYCIVVLLSICLLFIHPFVYPLIHSFVSFVVVVVRPHTLQAAKPGLVEEAGVSADAEPVVAVIIADDGVGPADGDADDDGAGAAGAGSSSAKGRPLICNYCYDNRQEVIGRKGHVCICLSCGKPRKQQRFGKVPDFSQCQCTVAGRALVVASDPQEAYAAPSSSVV